MSKFANQDRSKRHAPDQFYSGQFTAEELALVAAFVAEPALDDELWLQRVLNHRLLHYLDESQANEPLELGTLVKLAGALGTGVLRVARLLRDRQALSSHSAEGIQSALTRVLDELSKELGTAL